MTDAPAGADLPHGIVRVRRTAGGIELYYPPLRDASVALQLGVFGAIAFALGAVAVAALGGGALGTSSGALTAVLVGAFVLPFAAFGAVLAAQALFMVANALRVDVDREGIVSARTLVGLTVRRRRMRKSDVSAIEPFIASRYQSLFSREPRFHLVAYDVARRTRIVVAESLVGEALMERVRASIATALDMPFTRTGETAS